MRKSLRAPQRGAWQSFFLLLLLPLAAGAVTFEEKLAQIEETYQKTQTLQMEFVQSTFVHLLEKTVTRTGRIFYEKPGKIRIEYAGPKMTHYISDGKTLWVVHPKEKKTDTYALDDSGLPSEALDFLTNLGSLRKHFHVSKNKEWKIILKPKRKTTYKSLLCQFDAKNYLEELTIESTGGNKSHYRFFNRETDFPLPAGLFQPKS